MSGTKAKAHVDTDHEASSKISIPMTPMATESDPEFYFDDSLVVIQVESTLFRVHKFQLIKSETFSDMFKMPKGPAEVLEEGASRERPIVLGGVKSSDFRALLKVLYAFHYTNLRPNDDPDITVPAFRLAHMWNFSDLRDHLLPHVMDTLGCVDRIVLARELGIRGWLAPAHVELCQRTESLTMEEGTKLGMGSTIMITRLREQFHPSQSAAGTGRAGIHCNTCVGAMRDHSGSYAQCVQCGRNESIKFRFPVVPPSTVPPPSNEGLETQVKKWVEGGCVTE